MLKRNPRDPQYGEEIDTEGEHAATDIYQRAATEMSPSTPARSESRAANPQRPESVIDAQSTFDGRFVAESDLRIEGTISGELVCRGLLTIEREAQAKAKIEARDAHILGNVDGEITCSGKLELAPTAVVKGTIRTSTLVIQEGASLIGNVETKAPGSSSARPDLRAVSPAPADEPAAESPEAETATGTAARERSTRPRSVPSFALSPSDPSASNGRERA